jgi:hypothetical protein
MSPKRNVKETKERVKGSYFSHTKYPLKISKLGKHFHWGLTLTALAQAFQWYVWYLVQSNRLSGWKVVTKMGHIWSRLIPKHNKMLWSQYLCSYWCLGCLAVVIFMWLYFALRVQGSLYLTEFCPWKLLNETSFWNISILLYSLRPFNYMETFTPCIFLAYFGDMFFLLFSIIWGILSRPKFEVGLWYCYFHKKIAHFGFQALIYVI